MDELKEELAGISEKKESAIRDQDFERAAELRDEERGVQKRIRDRQEAGRRSESRTARRSP
jgi:ATP-dependent Clp protease ATP-binding subunit ClpC